MKKILLAATMLAICGFTLTAGGNPSRKNSTKLPIAEEYVMGNVSQAELSNTDFTMDVTTADAVVLGVESRTSSPVRIPRDPLTLMHPQIEGLYPAGEGAGYAGGIISSGMDGEAVANRI